MDGKNFYSYERAVEEAGALQEMAKKEQITYDEAQERLNTPESTEVDEGAEVLDAEKLLGAAFERKEAGVKTTVAAFLETPAGEGDPNAEAFVSDPTLENFLKVPTINSEELAADHQSFILGEKTGLWLQSSGGSTGKEKYIYYDPSELIYYIPPHMQELFNEKPSALVHEKRPYATAYRMADETIPKIAPEMKIGAYTSPREAIESILNAEVIYCTDYVAIFRRLLHGIKEELAKDPELLPRLQGKRFFLETSASPITIEELTQWYEDLKFIFGEEPNIDVYYSQSENVGLGVYTFKPGDKKLEYKIFDDRYVEVLDENGVQTIGQEGLIHVTRTDVEIGTVLPRYKTNDIGTLRIGEDGVQYLGVKGRIPESGTIDVGGYKFVAPDVATYFREKLSTPVHLIFKPYSKEEGRVYGLKLVICSQEFGSKEKADEALAVFDEYMKTERKDMHHGMEVGYQEVSASVSAEEGDMGLKEWRIVREEEQSA